MATRNVEMIYENGILRPLAPLDLQEGQQITVSLPVSPESSVEHDEFLAALFAENDKLDRIPSVEEVRQMLSGIKGSLADTIIADRGDY